MRKFALGAALALSLTIPSPYADAQQNSRTQSSTNQDDVYEQLDLLMRIFQRVRNEYVDEVDDKEVIEAAYTRHAAIA